MRLRPLLLSALFLLFSPLFLLTPVLAQAPTQSPFCTDSSGRPGVSTALGCIPYADSPSGTNAGKATISVLLSWGTVVATGIAFLVISYAAFLIVTAGGDPKKVAAGRELLVAALAGLVAIALSVIILNFLGVSVLGLGSLGFSV